MNIIQLVPHLFTMGKDPNKLISHALVSQFGTSLSNIEKELKKREKEGTSGLQNPVGILYIEVYNHPEMKEICYSVYNRYQEAPAKSAETEAIHEPVTLLEAIMQTLDSVNLGQIMSMLPPSLGLDDDSKSTFLSEPKKHIENFSKVLYDGLEALSAREGKKLSFLVRNTRDKYGQTTPLLYLMNEGKTIRQITPNALADEFMAKPKEEEPKKKT